MVKKYASLLCLVFLALSSFAKKPITLVENTMKIEPGKEEIFYFGFDEGDQLVLKFSETGDKELSIIEIIEIPGLVKFMDYKPTSLKKSIKILKKGIYRFRFSNYQTGARVCKIKISRIPGSKQNQTFNSSVYWKEFNDTTYYDVEEEHLKIDTTFSTLTDRVAKVHSRTNSGNNKTTFNFSLPDNTIAWSYYIGVDQEGQKAYNDALKLFNSNAIPVLLKVPDYGPLAALALGGLSYLSYIQTGEDIDYYLVSPGNETPFTEGKAFKYIKKGKVVNDFSRMLTPTAGNYHFCLENDNAVKSVSVTVKITAVMVSEHWVKTKAKRFKVNTKKEPYLTN